MKAIYKNIALAALALSAVACTQEEDFAPSYLNDPDAVRITAQVATGDVTGGFTRSNPLGNDDDEQQAFNNGDAIAVTAGNQDAVTYTFNGTDTWTPEEGKYLKWEANSMNFTAWYPVGEGTDANTFAVPIEYTEESPIAAADYMVYTGTQNKTSGNGVTLTMNRKMARIVITPILNDEFAEGYSITGIKVHANTSGYANGEPQTGDIQVSALKQGNAYYALLAPTTADANATFLTVTVTDGTTPKDLIVKGIPATAAGKSYDYTLTVGKDKATIGNVSVADWGTSQEINGGKAEEVNACYLPEGANFKSAIVGILPTSEPYVTAIEFVANLSATEMDDATSFSDNNMPPNAKYKIIDADGTNPKTLKICTDAEVFMFNEDCSNMFYGQISYSEKNNIGKYITSINLGDCINTSNVTAMNSMFSYCHALQSITISNNFSTSSVTNMRYMFYYCQNLESLNLSSFNTSKVTSMHAMFAYCDKLHSLSFGNNFNTANVTNMGYMFQRINNSNQSNPSATLDLDLTGFAFTSGVDISEIFQDAGKTNVRVKNQTDYEFLKPKKTFNITFVKSDGITPWE